MQIHLQKPGTADGVLDYTELTVWRAGVRALKSDSGRLREAGCMAGSDVICRIREERIELNIVVRSIKTWMIKNVERLHPEAQLESFR